MSTKKPIENIEVFPAVPEHQPILANLLELYAHDFSEFHELELGKDGRYGYPRLPLYWIEPNRHPFLVRINGKLAGLVLVKRGSEVSGDRDIWDMAEFFVVRAHRRCGAGTRIAHDVWRRFPGKWEIRVMQSNRAALQFWERAVIAFAGDAVHSSGVEKNAQSWRLFAFESPPSHPSSVSH